MADVKQDVSGGNAPTSEVSEAIKEACITGAVAFLLFVAIVGVQIKTTHGTVIPYYRFGLAIGLSLAIAAVRLVLDLALWRKLWSGAKIAKPRKAASPQYWLIPLAVMYLIGGVFFLFAGTWKEMAEMAQKNVSKF